MQNMDTWKFAHEHFGKQWWKIGWIILLPSVLVLLPVYNSTENIISVVFLAVEAIQMVFLLYPISRTERALKSKFGDPKAAK